jgi:hypothetical protein
MPDERIDDNREKLDPDKVERPRLRIPEPWTDKTSENLGILTGIIPAPVRRRNDEEGPR